MGSAKGSMSIDSTFLLVLAIIVLLIVVTLFFVFKERLIELVLSVLTLPSV